MAGQRVARITGSARTNVPEWEGSPPALPERPVRWTVLDLGDPSTALMWTDAARALDREVTRPATNPEPDETPDDRNRRVAAAIAAAATVGDAVAICGPEADVMHVRAELLAAGFVAQEVVAHAASNQVIRVRCVHCGGVTRHTARPGDLVRCEPCGYDNVVHHHFSRPLAAYLGFRSDAEEPR